MKKKFTIIIKGTVEGTEKDIRGFKKFIKTSYQQDEYEAFTQGVSENTDTTIDNIKVGVKV